jgi:hypothetical protein
MLSKLKVFPLVFTLVTLFVMTTSIDFHDNFSVRQEKIRIENNTFSETHPTVAPNFVLDALWQIREDLSL